MLNIQTTGRIKKQNKIRKNQNIDTLLLLIHLNIFSLYWVKVIKLSLIFKIVKVHKVKISHFPYFFILF